MVCLKWCSGLSETGCQNIRIARRLMCRSWPRWKRENWEFTDVTKFCSGIWIRKHRGKIKWNFTVFYSVKVTRSCRWKTITRLNGKSAGTIIWWLKRGVACLMATAESLPKLIHSIKRWRCVLMMKNMLLIRREIWMNWNWRMPLPYISRREASIRQLCCLFYRDHGR